MVSSILDSRPVQTGAVGKAFTSKSQGPPVGVMVTYAVFFSCGLLVYHFVADGEFSSILTMAVLFQCLGFMLLSAQVLVKGSARGISGRSLALEVLALLLRLSSTTWLNGYLPVDASGDFLYQAIDVCSLFLVCWLLYHVVVESKHSYQEDSDNLPILPIIVVSVLAASVLHADMNARPFFDAAWMAGLFMGSVAVLPQLWLVARSGGKIDTLTAHFIMAMATARLLSGTFMWHARFDVTSEPVIGEFNHAIWAILGAHLLNLLLLGDFGYYYLKALFTQGFGCQLNMQVQGEQIV